MTVVFAGGCADSASPYREVIADQATAFGELERILSTVTDEPSMKAAQAAFKKNWERCEAIKERALILPPPPPPIREQVYEESVRLKEAFEKVGAHLARIQALPG